MARSTLEVKGNTARSLVSKYKKGTGLAALAEEFGFSIPVVRRTLEENDVTIRGRGHPVA